MKNILFTLALLISFSSFGQDDIKQGLVIDYYESGEVKNKVNYLLKEKQELGLLHQMILECLATQSMVIIVIFSCS